MAITSIERIKRLEIKIEKLKIKMDKTKNAKKHRLIEEDIWVKSKGLKDLKRLK